VKEGENEDALKHVFDKAHLKRTADVNNAGGTETKPGGFEVLSDEDWQRMLEVNLLATVRLDRAFLPGMIERKSGVVIHISSVAHRLPLSNSTLAYAAAKGALAAYSIGAGQR